MDEDELEEELSDAPEEDDLDSPEGAPEMDAAPASDEEKVRELLDGVAALVKDVFDVDVDVAGGEPMDDAPMAPEPDLDMPDLDAAGGEEEEDLEEEFDAAGFSLEEDVWTEESINEVTQRVAKRLLEMTKKS